jgi:hypothetical protein
MQNYDIEDLKLKAKLLKAICHQMNERINEIGEIPRSDQTIKNWHEYDNVMWRQLLETVLIIDECYRVDQNLVKDCQRLIKHIDQYGDYTDNVLYPEPKITNHLSKKITTVINEWNKSETVKTSTFRTMMRIRELYCDIIGLDLPNDDSSIGKLNLSPLERLFEI